MPATISEQLATIGGQADATIAALTDRIGVLGVQEVLDEATIVRLTAVLDACAGELIAARTRSLLVLGTYRPDASTTGVAPD